MTQLTARHARTARRTMITTVGLLATATGTAAAHGSGSYGGGGMMGGGGGLFGGAMGLWGLLWMGLLVAVPAYLLYTFVSRDRDRWADSPRAVLRERYARGELSDEEFDRRRERLDRAE
ncbi:SHOCT domain-containing protein [Halapricum salinum]|uniref:SHOCT domain-containing protein n=1 Tax=Halapricum salinum TaxID=1457250 RepID=A0A4D6HEC1_9EURY|nr:SHOCT domain-containing protein [Halapricum salinum]